MCKDDREVFDPKELRKELQERSDDDTERRRIEQEIGEARTISPERALQPWCKKRKGGKE